MDYQRNLSYTIRVKLLQVFFLLITQTGIELASCADLDVTTTTNYTVESSDNVIRTRRVGLAVTCQSTNYTCDNLTKYELDQNEISVVINSCSPSVLQCLSEVYQPPIVIKQLEFHDMVDQGSDKDWSTMKSVSQVSFYLKDSDMLPNDAINNMPSLNIVYIEGGNITLPSNFNVTNKESLEHLVLNRNGLNILAANAFDGLKNLTSLLITDNHFEVMNIQAFLDLPQLEYLGLGNNIIENIELGTATINNIRHLKNYKMYNNSIAFLPNAFFNGYFLLEQIKIEDNQIEMKLDSSVFSHLAPSITLLKVTNCKIRELPESVFEGSSNLHDLNMNDNMIEKLHPNLFNSSYSIRSIALRGNKIDSLSDSLFSNMKKLEILDLSRNRLHRLSSKTFESNKNLRILNLNENNLEELGMDLLNGKYFSNISLAANKLKNVDFTKESSWETRKLNLSLNQIEIFEDWFTQIRKLEYLDLSSNKIKILSSHHMIKRVDKLTINLKNNIISQIVSNQYAIYDNKTTDENIIIYLSDNPFECDCLTTTILHDWNRRKIIGDFEELICVNGVNISTINVYLHCNEKHALIALIGTSLVGTLFGFIILASILTRWNKIWSFISRYTFNKNASHSTTHELSQDALKPYDLFISFAHQDEEFVTEQLLPKLEYEYGLKVCVHYRDWVVGNLIPDQIIQSVENARMTVIILTESFLLSDWSYLEFRTAYNLGLQEGKPRVILILLNEFLAKDERLSDDLKSYIAKNSYVVWRDPYFWSKLEKRLVKGGYRLNVYE